MKKILLLIVGALVSGVSMQASADVMSIGMEGAVKAPKTFYTKTEACTLKDNRYHSAGIEVKRTGSSKVQGYILFKKDGEVFYSVHPTVGKADTMPEGYIYAYNCKTKKAREVISNKDFNNKSAFDTAHFAADIEILGYNKGIFLIHPVAGVGVRFTKYVVRDSNKKTYSVFDTASYNDLKKMIGFSKFLTAHIENLQAHLKFAEYKPKDIIMPICIGFAECIYDNTRGEILWSKWDTKNNEKFFKVSDYGEGVMSISNAIGAYTTISLYHYFSTPNPNIRTVVKTPVRYNWVTNTIDTSNIETDMGSVVVDEN